MNISKLNTAGGTNPVAAGKIHHKKGVHEKTEVQASDATTTDSSQDANGISHPRLAAYADKIDARLSLAMESKDLSPRQLAALQQAKDHFHAMIHRLDAAYSNESARPNSSMSDDLNSVLDQLAGVVNHIRGNGQVDTNA